MYRKPLFSPPNISHPTIQSDRTSQNSLIELGILGPKLSSAHHSKITTTMDIGWSKQRQNIKNFSNLGDVVKCKLYSFYRDKSVMESAISFCNWDGNILIFWCNIAILQYCKLGQEGHNVHNRNSRKFVFSARILIFEDEISEYPKRRK